MSTFRDKLLWHITLRYAALVGMWHRRNGIHLKGVGFLLRRLRTDFEFVAFGKRWFVDHRIASVYASLVSGYYLEPETHAFLSYLAENAREGFSFINVGANIGEMAVTMALHPNVRGVLAFEPHPICAAVCRQNFLLNDVTKGEVRGSLVGNGSIEPFVIDQHSPQMSGIRHKFANAPMLRTVRLDDEISARGPAVMLIDVEGAELDVMLGGKQFIRNTLPVIIFEYHSQTRRGFSLGEVLRVLGDDYSIYRLRADGFLDDMLDYTYNCVAANTRSDFYPVIQQRVR